MTTSLHVYRGLGTRYGGVAASVYGLAQSLIKGGSEAEIVVLEADADWIREQGFPVPITVCGSAWKLLCYLRHRLSRPNNCVIHIHGLWSPISWFAFETARLAMVPIVISTHGTLSPWALEFSPKKRLKKLIARGTYSGRMLRRASAIHVTSAQEKASLSERGIGRGICLVPLGVDFEAFSRTPSAQGARRFSEQFGDKRVLLFMSRIHPVKGILDLIGAWKVLAPEFTDWHLVIAGPDESGHLSEVEEALTGLERVLYVGVLQGEDRIAALGLSELFVLPSYSENFGLVVAEALAAGTPVVTTRAAPWSDIEYSDCGWWIDTGQHALNDGLRRALQCDPESLALMGQRGQVLIAEKYSWRSVATQVSELYETVLRPAPQAQDRGRVL